MIYDLETLIERLADEAMRAIELEVDASLILFGMHPHSVAKRRGQMRRFRKVRHALQAAAERAEA